jgi:serine/threonine protein kinase
MKPLTSGDPARIGPFRIVARLGAGGMGKVYLGRAESTGKAVAIKTIHGDLVADGEFRARFSREVAAARQVRGPYIAEVVDADPDAANPWLATAYAPGISVSDAVNRSGPLPAEAVRRLGICAARALIGIHAVGLVHRDLKPDNVLLTSTGPKVIDFGIARGVAEDGLTRTGMVAGSPPYMAPEQLLNGEFGTGSDVFGLASILHYAATGIGPYGRGGVNELYGRAVTIGPVVDPSLPESLVPALGPCLTKEPGPRPSAAGLLALLEQTPGEDPGTGWLPGPVMAEILAQATEALSAESSGGGGPFDQPPQQFPYPQTGHAQSGQAQSGQAQPNQPQLGHYQSNWLSDKVPVPGQNQGGGIQGGGSGSGSSGPNWTLGIGGQQNQATAGGPQAAAAPQFPQQGVVNTPPSFAAPQHPGHVPYPQQQYSAPGGLPGFKPSRNLRAMWSMILGLASIPAVIVPILNLLMPGAAIALGFSGRTQSTRTRTGRGQALTGIIAGTVMIILSILFDIAVIKEIQSGNGN